MQTLTATEGGALAAPMIYSLVTSLDTNGKPNALGVSWVTRTSFDPFLLIISIDHSRYSHAGIDFHKEFVVNYPSTEPVSYTHLRAHETPEHLVCRLLLE